MLPPIPEIPQGTQENIDAEGPHAPGDICDVVYTYPERLAREYNKMPNGRSQVSMEHLTLRSKNDPSHGRILTKDEKTKPS